MLYCFESQFSLNKIDSQLRISLLNNADIYSAFFSAIPQIKANLFVKLDQASQVCSQIKLSPHNPDKDLVRMKVGILPGVGHPHTSCYSSHSDSVMINITSAISYTPLSSRPGRAGGECQRAYHQVCKNLPCQVLVKPASHFWTTRNDSEFFSQIHQRCTRDNTALD